MTLWPRSLFVRLALLLLAVVGITLVVTIALFRQDRAELIARQFGDTTIVKLQALRAALDNVDSDARRETLRRIGREYGVRIVAERDRSLAGGPALGPVMAGLESQLRGALGADTSLRLQPRLQQLWVRVAAGGNHYWVAFPMPRPQAQDIPSRAALWSITVAALLLLAAFLFARYLGRPLRHLNGAMAGVGRGELPKPLPESGPSEVASLNRGFNRMLADLRQLEHDRALLLAGVSHDLRTPLARLRVALEIAMKDEAARHAMSADIEEMDRIIGQFLDFARHDRDLPVTRQDPNAIVANAVERYRRAGSDVRFAPGPSTAIPLRATAFARLLANLLDNALAYGAQPVQVGTRVESGRFTLEVRDHGPGIPPDEVERLKQPFTRASTARANAAGIAGAGLGLAIVERIARLHGGTFTLRSPEGGGTLACVELPTSASAPA